ncbi:MoaD/ThiS family protein [Symmachiella dynata]|uniref:MoaD/ThiS family protein n=1 Tax=Symmachiella dynata TaxID=2527995 RepID=UPI0030EE9D3D
MKLDVRLFAQARDLAGAEHVSVELPDSSTVATLREALAAQFPQLAPLSPNLLIAIGTDYASSETILSPEADIACFPPVSGG